MRRASQWLRRAPGAAPGAHGAEHALLAERRVTAIVRIGWAVVAHLGPDHHVLPPLGRKRLQRQSDAPLALLVERRRVDEVDAALDRPVDGLDCLVISNAAVEIASTRATEANAAERNNCEIQSSLAERAQWKTSRTRRWLA